MRLTWLPVKEGNAGVKGTSTNKKPEEGSDMRHDPRKLTRIRNWKAESNTHAERQNTLGVQIRRLALHSRFYMRIFTLHPGLPSYRQNTSSSSRLRLLRPPERSQRQASTGKSPVSLARPGRYTDLRSVHLGGSSPFKQQDPRPQPSIKNGRSSYR